MDFRAKLIAGLEERKLQDERDKENSSAHGNPKSTASSSTSNFVGGDYNKNYKNKNSTYNASPNTNSNSANSNTIKNKQPQGKNNTNKPPKGDKNGFVKQSKKPAERVVFEGLARIAFFSDKKHYQALRSLAFYCGPEAFGALSATCRSFENFARNLAPRHFYRPFPNGFQQVTVKVLVDAVEKRGEESQATTVSVSNVGKQNTVASTWKDNLRAGETQENAFNRTLVPEFVGGIAVGVLSGETDKNEILRSKDLLSIQSYVELAARLFNGEVKQSLPLGNGTVRFSRYGFGGEKLVITRVEGSNTTTHAVNFDQFCLRVFNAVEDYVDFAKRFVEKQQQTGARFDSNLENTEKQQEKLSLLNQRFKLDGLQNSLSNLKRLLKIPGSSSANYLKGQERKGKFEKKKQAVAGSLLMELMQHDESQRQSVQAAEEQARKMTEDAKAQRAAEAEEKAKLRQLQREAMEREKESRTQILRKRVPGQVEQPKPVFTLPPPETPEQLKEKKKELKELRLKEEEEIRILNEQKAKKAEEKKQRKEQKRLNKEKEKLNPTKKQPQKQEPPKQQQPVREEPRPVPTQPVQPKPKTPEDIAAEKRAKMLEDQAEAHRLKKKQTQLAKIAQAEAKKAALQEAAQNKPPKEKKAPAPVVSNPKSKKVVARESQSASDNSTMIISVAVGSILLALIAYFLLYGQS